MVSEKNLDLRVGVGRAEKQRDEGLRWGYACVKPAQAEPLNLCSFLLPPFLPNADRCWPSAGDVVILPTDSFVG